MELHVRLERATRPGPLARIARRNKLALSTGGAEDLDQLRKL
jgi:hypothetical protein